MTDHFKIAEWLVKAAIPALGALGLLNAEWYGRMMFNSFTAAASLALLTPPQGGVLYSEWIKQSPVSCVEGLSGFYATLGVLLLVAMVAHVLARSAAEGIRNAGTAGGGWCGALLRNYGRHYDKLTGMFFLTLILVYFFSGLRGGLVFVLLAIVIPSLGYLLFNVSDLRFAGSAAAEDSPPPEPRSWVRYGKLLLYVCLAFALLLAVLAWPWRYGTRVFDPKFNAVHFQSPVASRCSPEEFRQGGPVFVAHAEKRLFFQICVDKTGTRRAIDFFPADKEFVYASADKQSLRRILETATPFAAADPAVVAEALKRAQKLFQP